MDASLPAHLKVIALEWRNHSDRLAEWAMTHLVNRRDVWGQFGPAPRGAQRPYRFATLPTRSKRGSDMVTHDKLQRHFGAFRRQHLIGLHAQAADHTSRWIGIDIDLHEPDDPEAALFAHANRHAAVTWWQRLVDRGFDPLLFDSNGVGGFHLIILFDQPVPTQDVYRFGQACIADWQDHALAKKPETYPRSGDDTSRLGAILRVPGLHHYRDHISRLYSGEPYGDQQHAWLDGREAIEGILHARPAPSTLLLSTPTPSTTVPTHTPTPEPTRATLLIDLDATLAAYEGWTGLEYIGDPLPGARAFLQTLASWGHIAIYSGRLATLDEAAYRTIEAWLKKHDLPYDEIVVGKPHALAIIDDRAVPCQPQVYGPVAYRTALHRLEALRGRSRTPGGLDRILEAWPLLSPEQRLLLTNQVDGALAALD